MRYSISNTAEYGDLTRRSADCYRRNQEGDEADIVRNPEWSVCQGVDIENQAGRPVFNALEKRIKDTSSKKSAGTKEYDEVD